jgi:hypothetical protein
VTWNTARNVTNELAEHEATSGNAAVAIRDATYSAVTVEGRAIADVVTHNAARAATYDVAIGTVHDVTNRVTADAIYAATRAAADEVTDAAIFAATRHAALKQTSAAIDKVTDAEIRIATNSAVDGATAAAARFDVIFDALHPAILSNHLDELVEWFLQCAARWHRSYQGGNMWASYDCYLTAMRDIIGLRLLAHGPYAAWEQCAIHGGFRMMHEKFCMVSDFPEVLKMDEQNRPHCDDGPSHRWRDGWSLYHIHGVKVDGWIVERPDYISPERIEAEQNAEVRRVMIDRYVGGIAKYLADSGAKAIDHDERWGTLLRKEVPDDEPIVMVKLVNRTRELDGSFKNYMIRVPPACRTAHEAVAWTFGKTVDEYSPLVES